MSAYLVKVHQGGMSCEWLSSDLQDGNSDFVCSEHDAPCATSSSIQSVDSHLRQKQRAAKMNFKIHKYLDLIMKQYVFSKEHCSQL